MLGFLIASVFWTAILAWQAADAPTDAEKQKCHDAIEKGRRKSEECKNLWEKTTADPAVFFNFWIAVFTAGLTVSTVLLWRAGERQLALAKSSSERQLRAYVYIEKTPIKVDLEIWSVTFNVKNFGQTPAHNVVVRYAFQVVKCENKKPIDIPEPHETVCLGSMAPLTDFYEIDAQVRDVSFLSIKNGEIAIYLTGSVNYDTVFAQDQVTHFRYLVGGDVGWSGPSEMTADDTGNDAT